MPEYTEFGRAVGLAESVDAKLKDLADCGLNAVRKLRSEIFWAQRLATVPALKKAQGNLSKLSLMSIHLEGAYVNSSIALREYASVSDDLKWINRGLGVCYLAICVSKVTDAIAQFSGPAAKLITSMKSAGTDIVTEIETSKPGQVSPLAVGQTANLTLLGGKALAEAGELGRYFNDIQQGFSAVIDLCKDISALISAPGDLKAKNDVRTWSAKLAKLVDSIGKSIKLYEAALSMKTTYGTAPGAAIAKRTPSAAPDYLAAAKYVLEAVSSFCQFVEAWSEGSDNAAYSDAANSQANRQEVSSGRHAALPDITIFAKASDAELISAIHTLESSPDARQMAYDAGMKAKQVTNDISEITRNAERAERFLKYSRETIAKNEAELKQIGEKLDAFRRTLGDPPKYPDDVVPYGWAVSITGKDGFDRIENARGKIQRYLNPVASRISTHGRFGPQVGPQ